MAECEYAGAQFDLGWMYFKGQGVEQNKSKAYYWWNKAKKNGYKDAWVIMNTLKQYTKK